MNLEIATRVADGVLEEGKQAPQRPLTVAVLDVGGHLVLLQRQDGAAYLGVDLAVGKAWSSLGMRRSSRALGELSAKVPAFLPALSSVGGKRAVAVPGGVCVYDASDVIGAVGVSGGSSDHDEQCAIKGVESAGFACVPPSPDVP